MLVFGNFAAILDQTGLYERSASKSGTIVDIRYGKRYFLNIEK